MDDRTKPCMSSLFNLLNHSDSEDSVTSPGPHPGLGSSSSGSESRLSLGKTLSDSSSTYTTPSTTSSTTPPGDASELPTKSLPKSKVDKKFFPDRKMVKIGLRRKKSGRPSAESHGSKLHLKSLEAALRVKLTLVPSLTALYCSLTPNTNRKPIRSLHDPGVNEDSVSTPAYNYDVNQEWATKKGKSVQLIDSGLVDLSGVSNKILLAFNVHSGPIVSANSSPTFNSLDTAISTLFGTSNYTLVRVTRSATNEADGSLVLKLETAQPGDIRLIDDEDFADDMLHSIGSEGRRPNNLFIKKIVARPRYKAGMKIYFVPYACNASLYVDSRMLERDLYNGVIDTDIPFLKYVATAFESSRIVDEFKSAVAKSCYSSVPVSLLAPGPIQKVDEISNPPLKLNN